MRTPTEEEILENDRQIEEMLNSPPMVIWSVIEELKDIESDFKDADKESYKHFLHQIDRLEELLKEMEK